MAKFFQYRGVYNAAVDSLVFNKLWTPTATFLTPFFLPEKAQIEQWQLSGNTEGQM